MNSDTYERLVKVAGGMVGVAFLVLSMYFSQDGFGIEMPNMSIVGWVLAVGVFVLEMIFNIKGVKKSRLLQISGLLAYIYGIYTNLGGILAMQGRGIEQIWAEPKLGLFPMILACFLEILPEPLIAFSVIGLDIGGLVRELMGKSRGMGYNPMAQGRPQGQQQPQVHRPQGVPQGIAIPGVHVREQEEVNEYGRGRR